MIPDIKEFFKEFINLEKFMVNYYILDAKV